MSDTKPDNSDLEAVQRANKERPAGTCTLFRGVCYPNWRILYAGKGGKIYGYARRA